MLLKEAPEDLPLTIPRERSTQLYQPS